MPFTYLFIPLPICLQTRKKNPKELPKLSPLYLACSRGKLNGKTVEI